MLSMYVSNSVWGVIFNMLYLSFSFSLCFWLFNIFILVLSSAIEPNISKSFVLIVSMSFSYSFFRVSNCNFKISFWLLLNFSLLVLLSILNDSRTCFAAKTPSVSFLESFLLWSSSTFFPTSSMFIS